MYANIVATQSPTIIVFDSKMHDGFYFEGQTVVA